MVQQLRKYIYPIMLWLIIALGMGIRIHNGDYFPIYQNDDSPFYVWLGNSIFDNFSKPASLTIFEGDNPNIFWRSQYKDLVPAERFGFRLTEKYFDHPFLASLVMALPARYFGYTGFLQIPQMIVRLPAFAAALMTLIMTYVLTKQLFNEKSGLLAVTLLAFWPLAIFAQRQGYLENMITPVWLLSLWFMWLMKERPRRYIFWPLVGCGVWAAWTKLAGYVLFGLAAYFLKIYGREKWAKLMILAGAVSLAVYLFYGLMVGGAHFWQTVLGQGNRGSYLTSIQTYFSSPQVQGNIADGWWYLGIIGMVYMATKKRDQYQLIGLSSLTWWLTAFILAGPQNTSPWYIYPVYPLLMIGLAVMIRDGIKKFPIALEIMLIILSFTGWRVGGVEIPSTYLRLAVLGWMGCISLFLIYPKFIKPENGHKVIISTLLILAIMGNVIAVRKVPQQVCGIGGCTEPTKIILPQ